MEFGFYYLQSRYYDPAIGRFISADTMLIVNPEVYGLNLFAYCGNDPLNMIDPSGYCPHDGKIFNDGIFAGQFVLNLGCLNCHTHGEWCVPEGYSNFLKALAQKESSNDHTKVNQFGYMGLYQFGLSALQEVGLKDSNGNWTEIAHMYNVYTDEDFLNSPYLQRRAVIAYHHKTGTYIQNLGLDSYIGTQYQNTTVTASGLLAACHLVGPGGVRDALITGGDKKDGNGTTAKYYIIKFGGYDLCW